MAVSVAFAVALGFVCQGLGFCTASLSLFLTLVVTQCGFLYALPAGLFLLSVWRETYFSKDLSSQFTEAAKRESVLAS